MLCCFIIGTASTDCYTLSLHDALPIFTWVNKSTTPHTVTAIQGTDVSNIKIAKNIFDSGITSAITPGATYSYTVTAAAYNFNPKTHTVVYYCQIHPSMLAELTIVQ